MKRIGRTILALLVALSVAVLPAVAAAASIAKSGNVAISTGAADCHHHASQPDHHNKTMDECACMAACAFSSFSFATPLVTGVLLRTSVTVVQPVRTDNAVFAYIETPPFRPPRV